MFTDGWNSFWHVVFGATRQWPVAFLFTLYQVETDWGKDNFFIDMAEFMSGWVLTINQKSLAPP